MTHVLPTCLRNLLQLPKHPLNRQRFRLEQRLLPNPTRVGNLPQVPDFLVLGFDLCEGSTAGFADRFLEERLADAEFEGFVFGGELQGWGWWRMRRVRKGGRSEGRVVEGE
jgi:hypothetical protein